MINRKLFEVNRGTGESPTFSRFKEAFQILGGNEAILDFNEDER